ncbi:NADH dehydrogenase (ubiquinone) B17.2 subunit [Arctopsyche grandis]|uniref:NADH dehydrogenase (ubiquinone) B17.2 subunit n=1 Tax=Arctopsyche grandis TaxID=121162 RepID=UPI00406D7101
MEKYFKLFALDKVCNLYSIIKQNGGLWSSYYKLYRTDDLKHGVLVGEDKYGNKYFENPKYFFTKNRWVEYNPNYGLWYDGSQIPPEWFGWMHYKTDLLPHQDGSRPKYKWMSDHTENMSGTKGQYVPYSTTQPKIEAWTPKTK